MRVQVRKKTTKKETLLSFHYSKESLI